MTEAGVFARGKQKVNRSQETQTLTADQSGERFVGVVDAVFTLPDVALANDGVWYDFECGVPSSGTGLSVSPDASDFIRGNGLTATADKDLINSGASDRIGDMVRVQSNGVDGWMITAIIGTWAKQS
jgi:hypothetical protein